MTVEFARFHRAGGKRTKNTLPFMECLEGERYEKPCRSSATRGLPSHQRSTGSFS